MNAAMRQAGGRHDSYEGDRADELLKELRPELNQSELQMICRKPDRLSVEQTRRVCLVGVLFIDQDYGVIGHTVELYANLSRRIGDRISDRAHHLRRTP